MHVITSKLREGVSDDLEGLPACVPGDESDSHRLAHAGIYQTYSSLHSWKDRLGRHDGQFDTNIRTRKHRNI